MTTLAFSLDTISRPRSESFLPLYVQIADEIADAIRSEGRRAIGKSLPSEIDWMNHLGVSRPTVRQAMSRLSAQGLITRHKGRGTFVADTTLDQNIGKVFEDEMRSRSRDFSFRLLEWKRVIMPEDLTTIFSPESGPEVYLLVRVRLVDEKIVGLEERYLPKAVGERLSSRELETQSLMELLGKLTGQREAQMQIVVSSEGANSAQAKLLGVKPGTPLLVRRNTCYFDSEWPLLHGVTKFIARNYQFSFKAKLDLPVYGGAVAGPML